MSGGGGLVHIDGHTDFQHPGDSDDVASLAREDLATAIGMHLPEFSDIDGIAPYFALEGTAHIGCRYEDPYTEELRGVIGLKVPTTSSCTVAAVLADWEGYSGDR